MMWWMVVIVAVQGAKAAFFDLTDVDDPLSLLWHTKDSLARPKNSQCFVQSPEGTTLTGKCQNKAHCLIAHGSPHSDGNCGLLSTCCTYRTCGKKTKEKTAVFESDGGLLGLQCDFEVETYNSNICQIRLDFDKFHLAPSITQDDGDQQKQVCANDYLAISPLTYNIPSQLCGDLDGQHIYVHLQAEKSIKLNFHTQSRLTGAFRPEWRIRITQLECPRKAKVLDPSAYWNVHNDFNKLAPEGAIQYFTAPGGRVRSFGSTSSEYTSGLKYAIAFRKTPIYNCIKFTSNNNLLELRQSGTPVTCQDYLFIPEIRTNLDNSVLDNGRFCPTALTTEETFFSENPGPFYIHFVSAESFVEDTEKTDHGFDLQYELKSSC